MDEKTREKMVLALDNAVRVAGAKDYEEGMRSAKRLFEILSIRVQSIQTIDDLRKMLDSLSPMSKRDEMLLLFAFKRLPQVLRIGLNVLAKKAVSTLPSPTPGRPRILTAQQTREMLDYVSHLQRIGCSLDVAKNRASQKYGCSGRTIDRLWPKRETIPDDEPTIEELLDFIAQGEWPCSDEQ